LDQQDTIGTKAASSSSLEKAPLDFGETNEMQKSMLLGGDDTFARGEDDSFAFGHHDRTLGQNFFE
jgi:hypothetical protein